LHVVVFYPSLIFSKSADATVQNLSPPDGITTITTASDSQLKGKMTNYETHSTEKSKSIFEIGFVDSENDQNGLGLEVGYYSTFGRKYPESEAEEDASWEESTTEQISVEALEKQLLDVLDKLAQQSSD
jgi:hypothetical protein